MNRARPMAARLIKSRRSLLAKLTHKVNTILFVTQRKVKLQRQRIPWRRNTISAYLLFPSNLTLKPKEYIYIPQKKEHNTLNFVRIYLCSNNVWRVNTTDCVIQSWPRGDLRLVADKTTKNKPRVDYEPRSAHGRAVNNAWYEPYMKIFDANFQSQIQFS